ncbi:hypothetical protein GSI_14067 [Ganoderma sinense ZZ0214-1]|uniref:Uncharacterized protein n=1 Tax=Ganoderma sinense ZZ0214-1 TaxID=1077348 RepID=A0A2G8RS25_9APHY|nr:hypothetical protein GSI_14067 [Ganoderma sinense ZZ0214-1]
MENESTFVAPEGVYSITEEHKPVPLVQHTISAAPILYPTKVSTVSVRFPATKSTNTPAGLSQLLSGNREKEGKKEKVLAKDREDGLSVSSSDDPDDGSPDASSTPAPDNSTSAPHDQPSTPFAQLPGGLGRRKTAPRPKHNMRTTSSTFITRLQNSDNLNKVLQSKQGETTFMFYNSAKTFVWTEAGTKIKEPLARIYFSAYPTCHDANLATVCAERLDIVIGFHTGDILWLDPITSRYGRFNKQGRICSAACTAIRWVPDSPNLFLVSHADGTIIVYDKEREDGAFTPQEPGTSPPSVSPLDGSSSSDSQGEWNPLDSIFVTMPPWHPVTMGGPVPIGAKPEKEKTAKNPVSHWRVSRRSIVDAKFLAAISEDGCLRVIDTVAEQLVDCYASYFGAFTCVSWSPDGRFILTGGQDDLVTIFSPWEQRVIARCQGHSSFVAGVAFDEIRCDGRTYRFGSIGEDNKFILWDFSSGALHRPKLHAAHQQRMSMTSSISLALRRRGESTLYLPPSGTPGGESPLPRYHPAPSRNEVAVVQPVVVKHIGNEMFTDISFLPKGLLTATKLGQIKFWIRPLAVQPRHLRTHNTLRRGSQTDAIG